MGQSRHVDGGRSDDRLVSILFAAHCVFTYIVFQLHLLDCIPHCLLRADTHA
jgi:hypothetical protein